MDNDNAEIVKLTERISKDPKSKLFVPLAEEYKKQGDIEMAVHVLTEGLKSNPGYVTARSFLGRLLLDQGDLSGAQKELEEVIKAIPDNLLAQRKLGDIYVLQGRAQDGLARYKAALTLNLGDKELTALIADLDAGRDVTARIPKPKQMPSAAPSAPVAAAPAAPVHPSPAKPAATASVQTAAVAAVPAGAMPVQAPVKTPEAAMKTATPAANEVPAPAAPAAVPSQPVSIPQQPDAVTPPASSDVVESAEDIEEVVELESLEHAAAAQSAGVQAPASAQESVPTAPIKNLPSEPVRQAEPSIVIPPAEAPAMSFDMPGEAAFTAPPVKESSVREEASAAAAVSSGLEIAQAVETPDAAVDDFNTDTLAELYISQGFYEKAIEIYQRMLEERPSSKPIQEKLARIRELAGEPTGMDKSGTQFVVPPDVVEPASIAMPVMPESVAVAPIESAPLPKAEASAIVTDDQPKESLLGSVTEALAADALTSSSAPSKAQLPKNDGQAGAATPTGRRKETIDRLENWLSNVMKEKG